MGIAHTEIFGRLLGIGFKGQLVSHDKDITPICADASIVVGDESANVRNITIQLKDVMGNDMETPVPVEVFVFLDAAGLNQAATGGSTGIEAGTDGELLTTHTAKKHFTFISEADGDLDLTWTDTGTEAAYLGLKLPTGRIIISTALTNA